VEAMKTYEEKIRETISDVIAFTWSYGIWWELVNKENFQRYSKAREAYPNFFQATIGSFEQGLCVITYRLFDEGKNNKIQSLPKLINHSKSSNASLAQQLQGLINAEKENIERIVSIRHGVYVHRNKSKSPQEIYLAAKIAPRKIKSLVYLSQKIVTALAETAKVEKKDFLIDNFRHCEKDVQDETLLILQSLAARL
jgi:AbiU2